MLSWISGSIYWLEGTEKMVRLVSLVGETWGSGVKCSNGNFGEYSWILSESLKKFDMSSGVWTESSLWPDILSGLERGIRSVCSLEEELDWPEVKGFDLVILCFLGSGSDEFWRICFALDKLEW